MTAALPVRGQDRYSGSRILKTLLPDLRLKRAQLLRVMRWCHSSASVTLTMNANDLGEQFCAQAMLEVRQGSDERLIVRFLPWAPDLIRFFQTNLPQLNGRGNLWPLADAAIAQRWDTTQHVLSGAWRSRWPAIPPDEMRRLISEAQAPQFAVPSPAPAIDAEPSKESKHVGRPTGMTEARIEEGRKLEKLIEKYGRKRGAVKKAAIEVYRGVRQDLAYDRARQTRKDYDRWKTMNREKN